MCRDCFLLCNSLKFRITHRLFSNNLTEEVSFMRGIKNKRLILGCAIVAGTGIGLFGNCIGSFILPVSQGLGFSRGAFAVTSTISTIISALTLPLYAKLFSKVSIRMVMFFCGVGCIASVVGFSFSASLWQFYLFAGLNGLCINGITMMATSTLLSNFFDKELSVAVAISFAGMGIISAVFLPVIRWIISIYGFKSGYIWVAIIGAILLSIAIGFVLHGFNMPNKKAEATVVASAKPKGFYYILGGLFIANFINLAIYNNTISYLTELKYSQSFVSIITSLALLTMVVAKPLVGALFGKATVKKAWVVIPVFTVTTAALALTATFGWIACVVFAVSLAFCSTVNSIPSSCFAQQMFSQWDYAKTLSLLTMACYFGSALGTPAGALVFDITGSYSTGWWMCIFLSIPMAFLLLKGIRD